VRIGGALAPIALVQMPGHIDALGTWRTVRRAGGAALLAAVVSAPLTALGVTPSGDTTLRFRHRGVEVARLDLAALTEALTPQVVTIDDPYYERSKSFRAFPLRDVLALGFGARTPAVGESFFFRARDGYVKPAPVARVREQGGYLAFEDVEAAGAQQGAVWESIDRRQVDPAPYYLIWAKPEQKDVHRYPWPYQLVAIEIAKFGDEYPHTVPTTAPPEAAAWKGFEIFRGECISCHAINGQGGTIGPELNVPQSIVEYRPAAQIKAYIRNPAAFRYTSMPAHPHLGDTHLEALLAYFEAMKTLKHDVRAAP